MMMMMMMRRKTRRACDGRYDVDKMTWHVSNLCANQKLPQQQT